MNWLRRLFGLCEHDWRFEDEYRKPYGWFSLHYYGWFSLYYCKKCGRFRQERQ